MEKEIKPVVGNTLLEFGLLVMITSSLLFLLSSLIYFLGDDDRALLRMCMSFICFGLAIIINGINLVIIKIDKK
jgi:hypothetical protein